MVSFSMELPRKVAPKKRNVHVDAVGMSFLRSPYVEIYRFNETPRASFRSRMSHLLRRRISCT